MSYDNAHLARVYLHAYQITGNEFYKRITPEILDYVIREMTDPNGGFYSSQDADTVNEALIGVQAARFIEDAHVKIPFGTGGLGDVPRFLWNFIGWPSWILMVSPPTRG